MPDQVAITEQEVIEAGHSTRNNSEHYHSEQLLTGNPGSEVQLIPLANIQPSKTNPRTLFEQESLEALAESIRVHGVRQPITVRLHIAPVGDGGTGYQIIAGERRFRAAQMAGLTKIRAIVDDVESDEAAMVLTLIENLQREQLNPGPHQRWQPVVFAWQSASRCYGPGWQRRSNYHCPRGSRK